MSGESRSNVALPSADRSADERVVGSLDLVVGEREISPPSSVQPHVSEDSAPNTKYTLPTTRRPSPTHRVAIITGPRSFVVETLPVPQPTPTQVRIRLEGCGVCGSNLSVWEGRPWFTYPLSAGAPGHEAWGHVEAVGDAVQGIHVGDRVAALSYNAYGECDLAEAAHVVPLPSALDGQPFPGEALGCAMNVFRRAEIRAGQNVAIIGIGFLGAVLTSLVARAGARVIAITRRRFALELAHAMGASDLIPLEERSNIVAHVQGRTNGRGCERVIEATGFQRPLDLAGELTAERGRLVIAGYHQDGMRQVNMQLWNWRGLDVINAHERDPAIYVRGVQEAVEAVASRRLDPTPLYTHRFAIDQVGAALDQMRARGGDFMKALVIYE